MPKYSFWKFTVHNEEAYYGRGSKESASEYVALINSSRDGCWLDKEEYTPIDSADNERMDQIAFQLNAPSHGFPDFGPVLVNIPRYCEGAQTIPESWLRADDQRIGN